jgi:general stress protein 26
VKSASRWWLALLVLAGAVGTVVAQQPAKNHEDLLRAAREIIAGARYAALITKDSAGYPQARVIDPIAPDSAFVVWIGTNPRTRKVDEIRRDGRVALYWFDPATLGYVTLRGTAQLVVDPLEKQRHWKPEWQGFYPDRERDFLLIAVRPERLEIVSPSHGVVGDSISWRPPTVRFKP